jgi:predicted unusual protein kinase regulating ubiquinone biosynthesis (AarF/ABC1/UbiB family)
MFYDIWNCAKLLHALYQIFYYETDTNIAYLKQAAAQCGPIGNKLLQFIMMHDGFLSVKCKTHFGHVFEDCVTHDWKETSSMYLLDFGKDIEEDYEITEESKKPIGSGSIGQVYKLYHRNMNTYVAMKVRHPHIEKSATRFVNTITYLLSLGEYVRTIPFAVLIREFLNNVHIQLDYEIEAQNTKKLYENFIDETHLLIPNVYEYSPRFIVMTYYDGCSFPEITDDVLRNKVSCDIYLFITSCMINFDFMHSDLHYGNWKVIKEPEYKLVIYDCGIVGSTKNLEVNKEVTFALLNGDYRAIARILVPDMETQKNGKQMKEELEIIMNTPYVRSSDRFGEFLKRALILGIRVNENVLRCVQGFIIALSIISISTDKLTNLLGRGLDLKEIIICYEHELLQRLGKYRKLNRTFASWIQEDPCIEKRFYEWLDDNFGHTDKDVFMDVIMEQLKLA